MDHRPGALSRYLMCRGVRVSRGRAVPVRRNREKMSLPQKSRPLWNAGEFRKLPLEFRVGAITSDGQWYTPDKVRSLCGEREPVTVRPIMDKMVDEGRLNRHSNGESYCMSLDQMTRWRNENNVPVQAQVISRIVAPRIFGNPNKRLFTENEFFADAPLHQIGSVTFYLKNVSDFDEIRRSLGFLGKFKLESGNKCKLICLSAPTARNKLLQYDEEHGGEILLRCNSNNVSLQRELCELDQAALADAIEYYVAFAPVLVPYIKKTFSTYMSKGSNADVKAEGDSIVCQWIIGYIKKYKETKSIPFSVLVQQIMPKQVYEYSSNQIGMDVNKFQSNKNKAIKALNAENGLTDPETYYSSETIRRKMLENGYKLSRQEYMDYDAALDSWRKTNWATDLSWDDGEQKSLGGGYDPNVMVDPFSTEELEAIDRRSGLQKAIITAGVRSGDHEATLKTLQMMGDSRTLTELLGDGAGLDLSDEFKRALASCISSCLSVDMYLNDLGRPTRAELDAQEAALEESRSGAPVEA